MFVVSSMQTKFSGNKDFYLWIRSTGGSLHGNKDFLDFGQKPTFKASAKTDNLKFVCATPARLKETTFSGIRRIKLCARPFLYECASLCFVRTQISSVRICLHVLDCTKPISQSAGSALRIYGVIE